MVGDSQSSATLLTPFSIWSVVFASYSVVLNIWKRMGVGVGGGVKKKKEEKEEEEV